MMIQCFASLRHTPSKISSPQGQEHSMSLEWTWYNHTLSVLPPALRLRKKKTTTEQSRHTEAAKGLFFVSPLGIPGLSLLQQQSKHSPSQIYLLAFLSRLRTFIAHTTAPTTIALCPGIQRWAPCNHPNQSISISSLLNLYSLYRVFQCFRPEPKLGKCVGRSADLGTLAFAIFSCCAKNITILSAEHGGMSLSRHVALGG